MSASSSTNTSSSTNANSNGSSSPSTMEFSPSMANQILSEVWEDRKKTYAFSTMLGNSFKGNCLSVWTRSKDRSLRMKFVDGKIRFYLVCGNSISYDGECSVSDAGRVASVYVNRYGILDR